MKHPLRAAALAAGALLCLSAGRAFADLDYVGDDSGGSWFLGYVVSLSNKFDEIRITINNGVDFGAGPTFRSHLGPTATTSNFTTAAPAFSEVIGSGGTFPVTNPKHDFSLASWHQQGSISTVKANAAGAKTFSLGYWLHLGTGPQQNTSGTRYTIQVYNHGFNNVAHLVATGAAYYKKTSPTTADELSFIEVVPVPAALWTGLPMLGGMILFLRRKRQNVLS